MVSMHAQLSVSELAERCQKENANFQANKPGPMGFCFELFRRAVVEKSQEAWKAVYTLYRSRMLQWLSESSCNAEDVVHGALEKFLNAVDPETFACFAGIGTVLAYLKRCVNSVRVDRQRKAARERLAFEAIRMNDPPLSSSLEQAAFDSIVNRECSEYIYARLKDEQERLVVRLNLEQALKPAEIVLLHPGEFPTVRDVYRVRERVIRRLSQDPVLQNMVGDRLVSENASETRL